MQKNVAGQYWFVYAFDSTTNLSKTGDAANITANLYLDGGTANAVDDTNPTEIAHGYYRFDISQAESNGNHILMDPVSVTSNILVIGVPGSLYTTPPNFPTLGIESDGDLTKVNTLDGHTPQTADHTANISSILTDTGTTLDGKLNTIVGSDGVTLATAQAFYAPAKAGDLMGLANDAITSAKFDESTAFPVKSADTGTTQIARVGADGDTLETLSDQLDGVGGSSASLILPSYLGDFQENQTIYIDWGSFGAAGQSITQSGLAVTDIEIYRDGSMTQRASDAGYTLLDTDGTDLDGVTGIHGVSIDLSNNSDAGFYARSHDYVVVLSSVTINGQTVNIPVASFSIQNRLNSAGVGDYAHTLTIRTTGGTAVAGVSVWVNSSNVRSGSVAGTKITDTNGQVVFNLAYGTYYVFCSLSGYTFASASFTSAAGSVVFTKDIAAVTVSGSSAFYSDSFLSRGIVDVRENVDEPNVSAKYTDARIIELLEKAYIIVLNEKNRNDKTPAVVKQTITVAANTTKYVLPYTMGSFYGLYDEDDSGGKIFYDGRSRYNPFGQRVWLEGQTLHIQSVDSLGIGTTLTAEWIPSGVARLNNGVCTISADGLTVTLGATPNAGTLDTHAEAYSGGVLRILGVDGTTVTGNYLQERNITAYTNTTRAVTLDVALSPIPTTNDGYIYYEVAPAIYKGMDMVAALYAAYRIMAIEGNAKRAKGILDAYRNEIRNVRLTAYYSNMPEAPRMSGDSYDNNRYRRL